MYFIDSTGHTFYQQSFEYEPIGYEYYQNKYIFWIDNKEHSYCSINNYYIRPVYILLNNKVENLDITIDSQIFSLIGSTQFSNGFSASTNEISIEDVDIVNELHFSKNDILELEVLSSDTNYFSDENVTKYMYPFYVVGNSPEAGTFMTNVLIHAGFNDELSNDEWCSITVGGEFNEESEILYINGRNMGVNLPHEIIRAVYNASYINDVFDEDLYNEKLKEYLIEYMQIRGEIGNYNSAIQSLKWFGWGNKIEIASLLKTDNQFMTQFIRDYFDTKSDIIDSFKYFINTTLLSLIVWENKETGRYNDYDLNEDFIGENQPELEDLFNKQIKVLYGGMGEETYYYRNYYAFIFGELMLKLSALKYYYEKYFLPVHLSIHNASLHHKVYANDIKLLNTSNIYLTEPIIRLGITKNPLVQFPKDNEIWLTEQVHIVDELYNEWDLNVNETLDEKYDYYYIHDTCGNIPIKFINYENEPQLHVHAILEKLTSTNDNVLYVNNGINLLNDSINLYDTQNSKIDLSQSLISYSFDGGKTYSPFFFGIDSLKNIIDSYNTKNTVVQQDDGGHYVIIEHRKIYLKNTEQKIFSTDEYNNSFYIIIPSIDNTNIDLFNNIGDCDIIYHRNVLLRIKIASDKIGKCELVINGSVKDVTDDITIMYSPSSEIFYESDFILNTDDVEKYLSFVLYPKMYNNVPTDIMYNKYGKNLTNNKINITYFVNNKFRLRMLVNNRWHQYDFIVRMPDIQIEFGKLIYKYHDNELKYTTQFNQLNDLTDDSLTFNSFMHEPRLTRINHINFLEDFIKYLKISSARYINGDMIPTNEFYYYIDVKFEDDGNEYSQRIYLTDYDYGNDIIVPRNYLNYDMIFYLFLDKRMLYIFSETPVNNTYEIFSVGNSTLVFDDSDQENVESLYNDTNNYKKFVFNSETNMYEVEASDGIHSFSINESLRSDFNTLTKKYIETHNITNNYKYLNQIHVYDLYRLNDHIGNNIISLYNNIDLRYHGIRFTHKSFLYGNTIHINGNVENLLTNSNERLTNNKSFESGLRNSDDDTSYANYASYVNTYDDLVIYSAYEGDWLRPEEESPIQPTGYVYYEKIDTDGNPTGIYTSENINIDSINVTAYFNNSSDHKDFDDLINFRDWLEDEESAKIYLENDDTEYVIHKDNENKLYINRNNINSETTPVFFKADIVKQNIVSSETTIINPTYSEYEDIKDKILTNTTSEDEYKIRIKFFIKQNKLMNNIQRVYEGDVELDENTGKYYIILGNRKVYVEPFFAEYDGNMDMLFNGVKSLMQQPGIDWISIDDLDTAINELDDNDDYIELSELENINDDDIKSLLKHRRTLIINVTSRMIEAINSYEDTLSFNDYIHNSNEDVIDIDLNFKIYNNEHNDNTDNVKIKTVMRCKYIKDDVAHYNYFDDICTIHTHIIKNEDNKYHIDCSRINDNTHYIKFIDNGNEYEYDEIVVFFALIPNTSSSEEFDITFNPQISLVYKDYDILEYDNDSFKNIDYNDSSFVEYDVNGNIYKYGDCRKSQNVIDLYNEFFDKKTVTFNSEYEFTKIDCDPQLNIDKNLVEYDMYLMHNTRDWYILYISKDTCDKSLALYDYEPLKKEIIFNTEDNTYKLIHNASVKKFLINRYIYSSKNGKNHFDTNDIIVGKVLNNERLPIDIFKTNKWEMTPISIGVNKDFATSTSNIDMCILDAPIYNNEYVKGYYDVTYRYSLDRISTQQYKKYGTIRIG